jgi:hypothetical protein
LRNKQTNEDEPHGLSSSSTPEKNNKNDDEPKGSSSSSTLEEKTKKLILFLHFSTYLPQMH